MRVLFLSRWYPYPPDNGSKLRISELLRGVCGEHDVTLISFADPRERAAAPPPDGPVRILTCPYREFQPASRRARLGYFSRTPRSLVDTHNPEMERLIRQAVRDERYDLVIASQIAMAAYAPCFRGLPAIFEEAELGMYAPDHDPAGSSLARLRQQLTWAKHTSFMKRLLDQFALCTVASDVERQMLAAAVPGYRAVHVVPNSVRTAPADDDAARTPDSLIFTGSLRYAPNRDAVTWFLDEIFPAIRAAVPAAHLTVTGDAGPQAPPPAPGVVLTGRVADVRPLLAGAAVSVAPIRMGGGTRLKILEAMALRTPVVATSKALEGIDARHGEHLLIADTPGQFAEAVRTLLRDPAGARDMAERAWHLCRARYDSTVVVPEFLRLVERIRRGGSRTALAANRKPALRT